MQTEKRRLTEKSSATPHTRSSHAHAHTDTTNAALPSIVFGFAANHRCRPSRLPTIDAYTQDAHFRKHTARPAPAPDHDQLVHSRSAHTERGTYQSVPDAEHERPGKLEQA